MERIIEIDGRPVAFKATAGTLRYYRFRTGRDLLRDLQKLEKKFTGAIDKETGTIKVDPETGEPVVELSTEDLQIFEDMAFVMAKQADPSIPATADEWLDTFEMFSIYMILPELINLWRVSEIPGVTQKKRVTP